MSTTCFILGAGFSALANLPVQQKIMENVLQRKSKPINKDTIRTLFEISDVDEMAKVPLEDVFTILDRAIENNETIADLDIVELLESRKALLKGIAEEFGRRLSLAGDVPEYDQFFTNLCQKRIGVSGSAKDRKQDPLAIISLNWDTLPEYYIEKNKAKVNPKIEVDYTCFDWDIDGKRSYISSILKKAKGKFNLKVMKLHGSLNWLHSRENGGLFIKEQTGIAPSILIADKYPDEKLENLIVTPTLLKNLSNTHLKMVWHNAGIDLSEAERIVFVGYSLPLADFEFRYLLLRSLYKNGNYPKIRVILYPPDTPTLTERDRIVREMTEERYRNFFGERDISFKYMDVKNFLVDNDAIWNW